jgi:predicted ATPase
MGLLAGGRSAEAWELAEETEQLIEEKGYYSYLPELLRLRGCILLAAPGLSHMDAETCFTLSLDVSRRQGAGAWEIRAATDLARLWTEHGRTEEADGLLRPVYERLTEGRDTPALRAAAQALAQAG